MAVGLSGRRACTRRYYIRGFQPPRQTFQTSSKSYNSLAALYRAQGRYDEAESLLQKALAIWERVLGLEHPNTADSYNNLGVLYANQGKWAAAREYLEKALAIWQAKLGEKHPHTIQAKQSLEYVKQRMA